MTLRIIALPVDRRVCVIGAGQLACILVDAFQARGISVSVFSNSELDEKWGNADSPGLFEVSRSIDEVEPQKPGDLLKRLREASPTIGIVVGWPAILGADILGLFGGLLFNFPSSPLPRFRGAATASWAILTGAPTVGLTIHQMSGKLDAGPVLMQVEQAPSRPLIFPSDYLDEINQLARDVLFPRFVSVITGESAIELVEQNEQEATYFPSLSTVNNGYLQFDWAPDDTVRFVRAFGSPYPGARFEYRDRTITCADANVVHRSDFTHPFVGGLINGRDKNNLFVHCKGGVVALKGLKAPDGAKVSPLEFRTGDRLFCSADVRESSMRFRSS